LTDRLKEVCKMGQGPASCRYLIIDPDGIHCAKFDMGVADQINARVARGLFTAVGDNCPGIDWEEKL
jgi:hypothetical protein